MQKKDVTRLIEEIVQPLRKEVLQLKQQLQQHERVLRAEEITQCELTARAAAERFVGLDAEQRKVFKRIDCITEVGMRARRAVEQELISMVGKPVTMGFVNALKIRLRERRWRIICKCGALAAPVWQRNPECRHGGKLFLYHLAGGKNVQHGSTTKIPEFKFKQTEQT